MTAGLDPIERSLLAQIAGGDDGACDVLADHWAGHGDPARGTFLRVQRERAAHPEDPGLHAAERELLERHGERWIAPASRRAFRARRWCSSAASCARPRSSPRTRTRPRCSGSRP